MSLTVARQIADTVLYEGYLLYPYRASSAKNQVRWQFGVVGPQGAAEAGVGEEPSMASTVLLETQPDARSRATVDVHVRFLQVQARVVERRTDDGWEPADALLVTGTRWIPFSEAAPREVTFRAVPLDELRDGRELAVDVPAGEDVEELREDGRLVGRLVRTRDALTGTVTLTTRPGQDARVQVLGVRLDNRAAWEPRELPGWTPRDVAARASFVGTHLLLTASGARVVSLLDGPEWATADAKAAAQHRCWPVLVADDDGTDAVLVAPIILGDHPTLAPESAGDLFDATEIDELLTLRVRTMTDTEKADARGTDPRAAAILDRCDAMTDAALQRLHGADRTVPGAASSAAASSASPPDEDVSLEESIWDAGLNAGAQPETDAVVVDGVPVSKGSRVLLRPVRRADAQDIFLAGLVGVVTRVYSDLDGGEHLAVVLEDDPASDLYGSTGRFYYFGTDEVEPLPARTAEAATPGGEVR